MITDKTLAIIMGIQGSGKSTFLGSAYAKMVEAFLTDKDQSEQ